MFSRQHLRGDVAFSDVYELKEEVGQTTTSVCRRCLHRVTAVEYSVKVANHHAWIPSIKPTRAVLYSLFILRFYNRLFILSDHREGEERPVRGDRDSATIRSTPKYN